MLWDMNGGRLLVNINVEGERLQRAVLSPDGSHMIAPRSTNIDVFDSQTGQLIRTLTGHTGLVCTMRFTSDSRILASASLGVNHNVELGWIRYIGGDYEEDNPDPADQSIRLWDMTTGELLRTIDGPPGYLEGLAFTTDGGILAASYDNSIVHLWDTTTGRLYQALDGHQARVVDVTFSPDGKIMASICDDRKLRFWDVATGSLVNTIEHSPRFKLSAFSPNGKLLATVSDYHEVYLWDSRTGDLLGHSEDIGVDSVSFMEDGQSLDTNLGQLSLELICPGLFTGEKVSTSGRGIFVKNPWVLHGTKKLFLLPPEYRATCAAYRDGVLAMGHENGRVSFIEFNLD